ncbi:MAG TPA: ubiquinol-cytochrome c reductase iron-sulfur subunit [Thermoanaerobaculia bacterium]|nr:ubiquinol-cytochrome c reductase iron-sulfur subunit [Thermoanaerobaculia bacterium]
MAEDTKDGTAPGNPGSAPPESAAPASRPATPPPPAASAPAASTASPTPAPAAAPPAPAAPAAKPSAPAAASPAPSAPPAPIAKPAAPAAAKPATAPAAAAADLTRRGFFSWAAVAWVGFTAAIGGCTVAMGRFMFPNVLFEPPTLFKANRPEDYPAGVVDTRLVDEHGVWIVHDGGKIFALIAICTHLGCPPAWLAAQNKFKCPCHGSGYYKSGVNFEGPTPRPLERAKISVSPDDGRIVVDKGQKFQWELGQWDDPNSFIPG